MLQIAVQIGRDDNADLGVAAVQPVINVVKAVFNKFNVKIFAGGKARQKLAALLRQRLVEHRRF